MNCFLAQGLALLRHAVWGRAAPVKQLLNSWLGGGSTSQSLAML